MAPSESSKKSKKKMKLTSVMEDYLESIFDLDMSKKVVRVKDIAKKMNVKMPTVTSMLKNLSSKGLVEYEKYEYVELTEAGRKVGREMQYRHEVLRKFLTEILNIEYTIADGEACKMEHTLSSDTLDAFSDFMSFIQTCPRSGNEWLDFFQEYRKHGCQPEKCHERSEEMIERIQEQMDIMTKSSVNGKMVDK